MRKTGQTILLKGNFIRLDFMIKFNAFLRINAVFEKVRHDLLNQSVNDRTFWNQPALSILA